MFAVGDLRGGAVHVQPSRPVPRDHKNLLDLGLQRRTGPFAFLMRSSLAATSSSASEVTPDPCRGAAPSQA